MTPKTPLKTALKRIALAGLLAAATVAAQTPYDEGQKALREQRWMDAAALFRDVEQEGGEQADAAIYWRGYAYYKAGRRKEAERELQRLERRYPESRWVREAQALRIEHQGADEAIEQAASGGAELDDDLRLYALAQLMERDPERALPLVMDLVRNSESERIRTDALFVLGMSEEPAALAALVEIAGESGDRELQLNAIQILGTLDSTAELRRLWPTLQHEETRIAAVEAFTIAGDVEMLQQILESESDPALRGAAITGIALEGGDPSVSLLLETSYANAASKEEKQAILHALSLMDDAAPLVQKILRSETDPDLQRTAIEVLGILEATEELSGLYSSLDNPETRKAVLEAMAMADDQEGLYRVLQNEQDQEMRSAAIQAIAINGGPESAEYLAGLYPGASRREKTAVIESMMIMDDSEALLSLLKQETDPELKREMLQMLTIMGSEESDEYLFELLEKNG